MLHDFESFLHSSTWCSLCRSAVLLVDFCIILIVKLVVEHDSTGFPEHVEDGNRFLLKECDKGFLIWHVLDKHVSYCDGWVAVKSFLLFHYQIFSGLPEDLIAVPCLAKSDQSLFVCLHSPWGIFNNIQVWCDCLPYQGLIFHCDAIPIERYSSDGIDFDVLASLNNLDNVLPALLAQCLPFYLKNTIDVQLSLWWSNVPNPGNLPEHLPGVANISFNLILQFSYI